ncbi:MAG: hypothetical protein DWH91_09240 [Planctomycetota bacterium]|nr:MAG: hypothetical protein DWH91_09240 [Planctomycetota bacterium]
MRPQLRVFTGEDQTFEYQEPQMSITLGELSRVLLEACRSQRSFLRDFEDDPIHMSPDLYQVLTAYCRLRPGA